MLTRWRHRRAIRAGYRPLMQELRRWCREHGNMDPWRRNRKRELLSDYLCRAAIAGRHPGESVMRELDA
ncbi:hypothetical protein LCGC14_1258380 [marine sediment metagenome]|uniref:Uncharacterized protein n=1 Tax=marine sediment metagenome TaxID=412755 RepID=A0A0F9L3V1_9ZZZZ